MQDKINLQLKALVNVCEEDSLREAMLYSISAGGKRLRPLLLLGACSYEMGWEPADVALDFACSLEMIHTYSLIHDDLPAMDNDDLRRGIPTCHKQFGEAMAILAGDALLSRAFETMAQICVKEPSPQNLQAMLTIISAAGDNGMIAGQVIDIHFQNKIADADTLFNIHKRKTGALFAAAFTAGALLSGGTHVQSMRNVGVQLGCAFQILDDLLDETSTEEILGKPTRSDQKNHKNTYVSVHGLEKTRADYKRISKEAIEALQKIPHQSSLLLDIVQAVIDRTH